MVDSISSSYRDQWTSRLTDGTDAASGTSGTTNNWNAVFTDEKEKALSVNDFLTLMVSQLKNQDFMNPVDNTEYVTQLAQFATMQQMEELSSYMKTNYVMSLVGKNVTAANISVSGELQKETGPIQKVSLVNNEYSIYVNGKKFSLEKIMEVHDGTTTSTDTDNGLDVQKSSYLLSLIGKIATVQRRDKDNKVVEKVAGPVEKVSTEGNTYKLYVNDAWYPLDDLLVVENAAQA